MSASQDDVLQVAPFVQGAASRERVIVRCDDAPKYLCLTAAELAAVMELQAEPVTASQFLGSYLEGGRALDFKAAVSLLVRLHQNGFVTNTSGDVAAHLKEAAAGSGRQVSTLAGRLVGLLTAVLDLPLVRFHGAELHPAFRRLGRLLVSTPAVAAAAVLTGGLAVYSGLSGLPGDSVLAGDFGRPEALLLRAFFVFSLAASWTAFVQLAALAGTGARFVGGSFRLTGLCVLRFATEDTDAFMQPRGAFLRYHLLTLLLPWTSALIAWQFAAAPVIGPAASLFAGTFALLGLGQLCPLYRSPLVKVAEGSLATLGVLERANAYLYTGLLSGLLKSRGAAAAPEAETRPTEHATQLWLTFFACVSILWLYGMSLLFADALLGAVPDLWVTLLGHQAPARKAAALVLLLVLAAALLLPLLRLVLIPFQNLAAAASLPLRRARRGIGQFYDQSLSPSAAVTQFLAEIPVLADLTPEQLGQLTAEMKYRRFSPGQAIITRGEIGEEFFIMADGEAQVIAFTEGESAGKVVDVLSPGDSFGEIALVEKVGRTATIRAVTPVKTLVLGREAFDRIFPEGTEARTRLTSLIRQVKLVLESQVLSHLAPRQVKELLRQCRPVRFQAGDFLIREDTPGDHAFLLEAGEVQVVNEQRAREIAVLGRGELVGAIALLKGIRRTASVRARTDVAALAIDKATFLKMCMSNMFVALLVTDLSDRQIAETKRQAG